MVIISGKSKPADRIVEMRFAEQADQAVVCPVLQVE
jgi:hypothetical protein